ncbi:distal membrane-arm assembly complex protein 2-like [Glandiceps talaboti]
MAASIRKLSTVQRLHVVRALGGGCIQSRPRQAIMVMAPMRNVGVVTYYREKWKNMRLKFKNERLESRVEYWGSELAAAHWLLYHNNAAIQFTNGKWYMKNKKGKYYLPRDKVKGEFIMSIDVKSSAITYEGMDNIICLEHLKYLGLKECPHIDDFCLAKLHHFKDSLTHLNISSCPQITERGLATLHRLRKLERLNIKALPKVESPELVAMMLEDVLPNLQMKVVSTHIERHLNFMAEVKSRSHDVKKGEYNRSNSTRTENKMEDKEKTTVST